LCGRVTQIYQTNATYFKKPNWTAGRKVGYLKSVEKFNLGLPMTNPANGRKKDMKPGLPDYKSSAL